MYAIFKSGGRQYQGEPGKVVKLEKLPGAVGDKVTLEQVLLIAEGDQVQVGKPVLQDMAIQGRIVEQARHRKVVIFKHKRRKGFRKTQGHRQYYTAVLIEGIGGQPVQEPAEAAPSEEALS